AECTRSLQIYFAVGQPSRHIGQHRPIPPQITDAATHCAEPIYFCLVIRKRCRDHRNVARTRRKIRERSGETTARSFQSTLYVGLKPNDPKGGELPVVADLTTTDEATWVNNIGASKPCWTLKWPTKINRNRGGVEIGFNVAKAGTGIHASVPPSPVIDGCGYRRRSLDGHISRKSGRFDQCNGGDGNCQLLHGGPPESCRFYHVARLGRCCRFITVKGKSA